jgi:hypothetical protein
MQVVDILMKSIFQPKKIIMKKSLKISTIALVMLSLFTVSCEKPDAAAPPAPAPVTTEVKVTWTPEHSSAPITVKGDVTDGELWKDYVIEPTVTNAPCPDGTWSIVVEPPAGKQFIATSLNTKGKTNFRPLGVGAFKIILTYKCPGCKEIQIIVKITVK